MITKEILKDHTPGVVKEIKDKKVTVIFCRSSACGKCQACGLTKETGEMQVSFAYEESVEVGDSVGVYVDESFFLLSAFLLYGLPLAALLLGTGIASALLNDDYGQVLAAVIGIGTSVASYFVLKQFDGYFEKIKTRYMRYTKLSH